MSSYRFNDPPARPNFGPLKEGDYPFVVAECDEPYQSNAGNYVLPLKLSIQPDGTPVFDNPWAGTDKNGDDRDGIAEFLLAVNRAPKRGQEPNWSKVVGAKGKCHLKVVIAEKGNLAGKEVNKVGWYFVPKQIGPAAETQEPHAAVQTHDEREFKQAAKAAQSAAASSDLEPDDIPF
jgi:hypothetical protein